jgi:hypothetical protein
MPNIYLTDSQVQQVYRVVNVELIKLVTSRGSQDDAYELEQVVKKLISASYDASYRKKNQSSRAQTSEKIVNDENDNELMNGITDT